MSLTEDSHLCFHYKGFGRELRIHLEGNEAEYLPKILTTFADFLRASGFVYVGVIEMADGYLFHKNYSKNDDDSWGDIDNSEFFGLSDDDDDEEDGWPEPEDVPVEAYRSASDYWDKEIDKYLQETEASVVGFEAGDIVFYHGRGTPETTLNLREEPQGHGGHNGVSLMNMRGKVIKIDETPVGLRALVRWDNWNDGHNGMGGDPDAKVSDQCYWWSNINNISKSS